MSTLLNRLRRNQKPKPLLKQTPVSGRCVDSCCYENSACTVESVASSGRPSSSSRSGNAAPKDASGRPILRRSDTFTLKEGPPDELPDHLKYATYRKKKAPIRGLCVWVTHIHQKHTCNPILSDLESIIEQDVFESLYKRPIKTPPVQTQRSFQSALREYPTPSRKVAATSPFHFTAAPVTPAVVRPSVIPVRKKSPPISRRSTTSSLVSQTSSHSSSPSIKPPEYFFGSLERPSVKTQPADNNDRFRTITLRDVRRSFREKYLPNNGDVQPANNKHLPIWFVDVAGGNNQPPSAVPASPRTSTDRETYRSLTYMEFNEPASETIVEKPKVTVNRQNTFNVLRPTVERPPAVAPAVALQRRETFKVHEPMFRPTAESTKGYYLNRYRKHIEPQPQPQRSQLSPTPPPSVDRFASKAIPVGIAVPYNSSNDRTPSPPLRRHRRSPSPQQRPQSFSTATYTRKVQADRNLSANDRPLSTSEYERPIGSKISFDALRKPVEQPKDASQTNLGFDRFYDPNYFVPKNQNLFGPLATAQLRAVNVVVQPKVRTQRPVERKIWY